MSTSPTRDPREGQPRPPFKGRSQREKETGDESEMDPAPDYGEKTYRGHGRLTDRVAIITGGDSGIGRAVALAFAREGADVVIDYYENDRDAEVTRRVVEGEGRGAIAVKADVGDAGDCERLVREAVERFGRVDILVNNAAYQGATITSMDELDPERVERTFRTNIVGMFHLVRLCLPHMRPGATVINTASIQAYQPSFGILDYAATKGAIVTFTKGLALGLIEKGIRVNCVAPGPVWTPIVAASFDDESVKRFGEDNPMGRPAQPVELAPAFVFLASDESRFVNGEVLGVTGGKPLG